MCGLRLVLAWRPAPSLEPQPAAGELANREGPLEPPRVALGGCPQPEHGDRMLFLKLGPDRRQKKRRSDGQTDLPVWAERLNEE